MWVVYRFVLFSYFVVNCYYFGLYMVVWVWGCWVFWGFSGVVFGFFGGVVFGVFGGAILVVSSVSRPDCDG